jgi:hypothetical protein
MDEVVNGIGIKVEGCRGAVASLVYQSVPKNLRQLLHVR